MEIENPAVSYDWLELDAVFCIDFREKTLAGHIADGGRRREASDNEAEHITH